jgi:hypothetical protein
MLAVEGTGSTGPQHHAVAGSSRQLGFTSCQTATALCSNQGWTTDTYVYTVEPAAAAAAARVAAMLAEINPAAGSKCASTSVLIYKLIVRVSLL